VVQVFGVLYIYIYSRFVNTFFTYILGFFKASLPLLPGEQASFFDFGASQAVVMAMGGDHGSW